MEKVNAATLAKILGLSKSRISRLKDAAVLRPDQRGMYDVATSVQAYLAFIKQSAGRTITDAKAELVAEQTRRHRIANDLREGQVVELDDVDRLIQVWEGVTVRGLESLPGRCAGTLAGMSDSGEISSYLRQEVRGIRLQLADAFRQLARECNDKGWRQIPVDEVLDGK